MSSGSTKLRDAAVGTRRVVPRSRTAKNRPAHWSQTLLASPVWRSVRAHPGKAAAAMVLGALMTGIIGNAVWFQRGRHPAPLFGGPRQTAAGPDSAAGLVPLPLPRRPDPPAEPEPHSAAAASGPPTGSVPATDSVPSKQPSTPPAKRKPDGIASLLRNTSAPTTGAAPKTPDAAVLQAQRALAKLGFAIKPDGHMGSDTRKALDKFATDHHLDGVTGSINPKLLHDLAAAAAKPRA